MDQLLIELIQCVLLCLDLNSLRNAALSCRFLFDTFRGAEVLITSKTLFQQIDYDVLPEAILVNKSWRSDEPLLRKGLEFAENVADALPLVQFHERSLMFFNRFAIWENEQLACVYDYLTRLIAKPFNYLLGYFLGVGLENGNLRLPSSTALSEMDEEVKKITIGVPFYDEPDPGLASMWEWIYRGWEARVLMAKPRIRTHRQWAFPFWNLSRLKNAGLLGDPDIPGLTHFYDELELREYSKKHRRKLLKGGSGRYGYQI
ncbi:hypothetical protein F5B21DRAFT_516796 [Xylaria acuta]|nr:hypothetical protein F5B21DRAFT_516796 [Xylaria acuta]